MVSARRTPSGILGGALFASRWLLAPFYVGLTASLGLLLGVFTLALVGEVQHLLATPMDKVAEAGILMTLSLIDMSLTANLLVIVSLVGYENFVARIAAPIGRRPSWMGVIDYSGMKMRLIASIVAISAVALLRSYLEISDDPHPNTVVLTWQVVICLTFGVLGVLLAIIDWLEA